MKICRFNENRLGLVEGDQVRDVSVALDALPPLSWPAPKGDYLIAHLDKVIPAIKAAAPDAEILALADVKLYSPVANPSKIMAAPSNYAAHNQEMEDVPEAKAWMALNPGGGEGPPAYRFGIFLKSNSSLAGPADGVPVRLADRRNDHELELAVIIGKPGEEITPENAYDHVAGYAIGLDMSLRGQEERSLRKSAPGYSVVGPWLVTPDEIDDPQNLDFELTIGGETRQKSNTSLMLVNIRDLIVYASRFYTLNPGDIILSGTSAGVGPVEPGDVMHCEFAGIGVMDVPVSARV